LTAPVGQPPYAVVVRNSALARVGKLDRLTSLTVTPRFNGVGAWSLSLPLGSAQAALFTPTSGVIVYYGDEGGPVLMSGPVKQLEEVWDESNPGAGTLTVTGLSDEKVVADRLAYQVPGSAATSQGGSEYDRRSGVAETVVKAYVNLNAGPGALAARRVTGLTIETDAARGATVKGSARMTPLAELITPLALSGGIGWRVVQVGAGLVFQCYAPTDRTLTARFSRELGNLRSYRRTRTGPDVTAAVVGGGGDGTARIFREIIDTTAQTDWAVRAESFIDRRDTTDTTELDQAGTEATVEGGPQTGLALGTLDTPGLVYGTHYGLGDKVTAEPGGGVTPVADVLREVEITWSASDGPRTTSTVGTSAATGSPRLIRALQTLNAKVAALQAKK
jgi:hypothetical protein